MAKELDMAKTPDRQGLLVVLFLPGFLALLGRVGPQLLAWLESQVASGSMRLAVAPAMAFSPLLFPAFCVPATE